MTKKKRKMRFAALSMSILLAASCLLFAGPDIPVVNASGDSITAEGPFQIGSGAITFDSTSDWNEAAGDGVNVSISTTEALKKGVTVEVDLLLDAGVDFAGIMKLQGVARLGDLWEWTPADNIVDLQNGDFTVTPDGTQKSAHATFHFDSDAIEQGALAAFTIKPAGYQCDYSGTMYIANVVLTDGQGSDTPVSGDLVASLPDRQQMYGTDITFDNTSDWDDKGEFELSLQTDAVLKTGARITMDILIPKDKTFSGSLKFQGVTKVGAGWDWTQFDAIPELTDADFTVDGEYKKATVAYTGDPLTTDEIKVFIVKAAGYYCDYSGPVYIENVCLYDGAGSGEVVLPEKDPAVIDDFEDGTSSGWVTESGWQYDNAVGISAAELNGQRMLKLDLDYTGYGDTSWSEAKIKKDFDSPYDVSAYNYLTVDFYYPEGLDISQLGVKFFADGILNKDVTIEGDEAVGSGYKKGVAAVKFSPTATPLENLTLGLVGKNTTFNGSIYIDNITLSQYNAAGDYVPITSVPNATGTQANAAGMTGSVTLADANATVEARRLYSYLQAIAGNDQVLFGHENDYNKKVSQTATEGDVKELTGSLSAIYGLDTLAIAGAELGLTDPQQAMDTSVANSLAAARQGSIVSLSAHMPNFTNEKITVNPDGSFNFTTCDFGESKDLSNNCAEQILPGGDYNKQFNAYLDMIAEYALALQAEHVPILFRPFHENNGGWFWWGSSTSVETYKSLYRYTEEYLEAKGVHNMLYVYSPNGPFSSESKYMERYPGDEYVDILAFDYYDDYNTYPATADGSFFANLRTTCQLVSALAAKQGKLAAISETGVRVMKKDGSDNEGLLVTGNPVAESKTGKNWYQEVCNIAQEADMPYYLVWANFSDTNFYVPYKYNDTMGHEMINEFIDFYNNDKSVFADGTNFYSNTTAVTGNAYTNPYGYMIAPFDRAVIKDAMILSGSVTNGNDVKFVITNPDNGKVLTLAAVKQTGVIANQYQAALSKAQLDELGTTDLATIQLMSGDTVIVTLKNVSLGKDKDQAPANVIDNFDYYVGSDSLLQSAYTENSAGGCSSEFLLDSENKIDGAYGGAFHYVLETAGNEVWTGQIKTLDHQDYSAYNAIEMWVKPDGKGQKLVVQFTDSSGEEFEVYLTDFVKGTKAQYVTIPFTSFAGKKGGTLDSAHITKFAIWCNSIPAEGHTGTWKVDSTIYFDGIQAVALEEDQLKNVDANGLIITDASLVKKDEPTTEEPTTENPGTTSTTPGQTTADSGKNTPKTGDSMPIYPVAGILLLSLLAAGGSLASRKYR